MARVEAVLGPPPIVRQYESRHETQWLYPVRIPTRHGPLAVRAPMIVVTLDASDRVEDWRFIHPLTKEPLPIRETAEQADAWRAALCSPPRRIELATLLHKGASADEVLSEIGRGLAGISRQDGKHFLTFYAERPSPLFIPPFYVQVIMENQTVRVIGLQGWGGCDVL